jgi:hypothetical protein
LTQKLAVMDLNSRYANVRLKSSSLCRVRNRQFGRGIGSWEINPAARSYDYRKNPKRGFWPWPFAWDEGEGDRTRAWWLDAHRGYFARQATREGFELDGDILTVFERFEVVWPLDVAVVLPLPSGNEVIEGAQVVTRTPRRQHAAWNIKHSFELCTLAISRVKGACEMNACFCCQPHLSRTCQTAAIAETWQPPPMGMAPGFGPDMKIPTDIFAKFAIAFTPPANEQEVSLLFRRRVAGMSLPVLRIENIRLTRQLRSVNKKLFLDGVKVGHLDRQTYFIGSASRHAPLI